MLKSSFPGMGPYLEAKWPEVHGTKSDFEPASSTRGSNGRYHRLNYQLDPQPKFDDEHARWIDARLREEGRRV